MHPDFCTSGIDKPCLIEVSSSSLTRYTLTCRLLNQTHVFMLRDITQASLLALRQELGKQAQAGVLPAWVVVLMLRALMDCMHTNAGDSTH